VRRGLKTSTHYFSCTGRPSVVSIKSIGQQYAELVFLHLMAFAGHIVHSGVCGTQKVEALFFVLACNWYRFYKNMMGHVTPNLCFCICWDLRVTKCISVCPGFKTLSHYFSCSWGTSVVSIKSASGNLMLNLCFCT
jgi:hypothetical protein